MSKPVTKEKEWFNIYGQYLDTTADVIQNRVDDGQIVFYFLKEYELKSLEFETILEVDGRVEITLREIDSDEGGNTEDEYAIREEKNDD